MEHLDLYPRRSGGYTGGQSFIRGGPMRSSSRFPEWTPYELKAASIVSERRSEDLQLEQLRIRLQKKMQETVVEASSGGGTVTAKMDGRKQLLSLRIDPEAVKSGDVEMLQDLVLAAINEAARKVDGAMQSTVGGMLGGLGM